MSIIHILSYFQLLVVLSFTVTSILRPAWETTVAAAFAFLWVAFTQWLERRRVDSLAEVMARLNTHDDSIRGFEQKLKDLNFVNALRPRDR